MQNAKAADLLINPLFAADRVGADRRNLHFVEPLHEFFTVFEARLVIRCFGLEKGLRSLLVVTIQPSGMKHQNIVLLDRGPLLLGRAEEIVERDALAALEMLLALVAGGVDEDAAANHPVVGNWLNRAFLQSADGGFRIVAIVELFTIPGMAERIVLSGA